MSEYYLEKKLRGIKKQIREIEYQLMELPEEKLVCLSGGGNYTKWYISENSKYKYLPKNQRDYAEKLALRKFLTEKLKELQQECDYLEEYLLKVSRIEPRSILLQNDNKYAELLRSENRMQQELEEWASEPFEGNPYFREKLVHNTLAGYKVRSKSERTIANELWTRGIPFRYEAPILLSDGVYYPDFTIRHPRNGIVKYWEHLGLGDDSKYVNRSMNKVGLYIENGIILSVDLIVTCETEDKPIDVELVNSIIDFYFG